MNWKVMKMKTIDTITDIIVIVLAIIYIIAIILLLVINLKPLFKPNNYYEIHYHYDHLYVSKSIVKAKTPKQAIDKLIRKYQRNSPLNDITDIISCTEVNYYKCLKEVSKDD